MDQTLQDLCEQFIEYRDLIRDTFRWESNYIPPVCANLFCARGLSPDAQALRNCRDLINRNTGIFSCFRGYIRIPLACMLSMDPCPEEKFRRAQDMFQALREYFRPSDYLALAAFLLTELDCTEQTLARGKRIWRLMNDEHPLLTSTEDSIFAVMMAFSKKTDGELISDMEECYRKLKESFRDSNCVQTMAQILAMEDGASQAKTGRVLELYDTITCSGGQYGKHYELATLAALAMMKQDPWTLARDIMKADAFLAQQKGYGFWKIGEKTRMMHAALIVSDAYVPHDTVDQAALTGTLSLLIAQQMALCAAMISADAAASVSAAGS